MSEPTLTIMYEKDVDFLCGVCRKAFCVHMRAKAMYSKSVVDMSIKLPTISEAVAEAEEGFACQLQARLDDGQIRCPACGSSASPLPERNSVSKGGE